MGRPLAEYSTMDSTRSTGSSEQLDSLPASSPSSEEKSVEESSLSWTTQGVGRETVLRLVVAEALSGQRDTTFELPEPVTAATVRTGPTEGVTVATSAEELTSETMGSEAEKPRFTRTVSLDPLSWSSLPNEMPMERFDPVDNFIPE
jgi:hypothetical protein